MSIAEILLCTYKNKTKQNPSGCGFGTLHALLFAKPKIKQDSIKLIATEIIKKRKMLLNNYRKRKNQVWKHKTHEGGNQRVEAEV